MGFIDTHFLLRDDEYYKFRSSKPEPMPGAYLIQKTPFVDFIKVTRPDGSSRSFHTRSPSLPKKLMGIGIPLEKQDRVLAHAMNFQAAYVKVDFAENWGSKLNTN